MIKNCLQNHVQSTTWTRDFFIRFFKLWISARESDRWKTCLMSHWTLWWNLKYAISETRILSCDNFNIIYLYITKKNISFHRNCFQLEVQTASHTPTDVQNIKLFIYHTGRAADLLYLYNNSLSVYKQSMHVKTYPVPKLQVCKSKVTCVINNSVDIVVE